MATLFFIAPVLVFSMVRVPAKAAKAAKPLYPWMYSKWVPDKIENQLVKLARYREKFCTCCPYAGSNIDTYIRFHNVEDVFRYVPRALEIGWLAPFPNFVSKPAKTSGRISRIIVGIEMFMLYFFMAGVVIWIVSKGISFEFLMLFCWATFFILLISLTMVNMGTLYRWRHIYFLPVFIYGVGGWLTFLDRKDKTYSQ